MSIFDTVNPQAEFGSHNDVAYSPTAGFFEGWQIAYEAHVRASSMSGLEHAFETADEEQARAWGQTVDGSRVPRLRDVAGYEALAKYFVDGEGLDDDQLAALQAYDTAVTRAQESGISVQPARSVFEGVQQLAQRAEADLERTPTTVGGDIGQFMAGMVASLDPRTDFWNFATLPVGGAGKTVLTRVGGQMLAQGAIETINQITGVQENRRLLGLPNGFRYGATQVLTTALGAGVLQGAGEGLVALGRAAGRRWFGSPHVAERPGAEPDARLEEPPPPPVAEPVEPRGFDAMMRDYEESVLGRSPWRGPPSASVRTERDLLSVTQQLEDWSGPRPWALDPARTGTMTAIGRVRGTAVEAQPLDVKVKEGAVDTLAREIDPHVFREFDDLASRKQTIREEIDRLQGEKASAAQEAVNDISDEITRLKGRMAGENRRKAKITQKRIDALEQERDSALSDLLASDTLEIRYAREYMQQLDYNMRDLAPLVTRAYTKARKRWAPHEQELEGVVQMIRDASNRRIENQRVEAVDPVVVKDASPVERVLSNHPDIRAEAKPGDDAADLVQRAVAAEAKVLDATVEQYRAAVSAFEVDGNELRVDGIEHAFSMDEKIAWPLDEDGGFQELTIREILERGKRDELELQSVMVCSTRKGS